MRIYRFLAGLTVCALAAFSQGAVNSPAVTSQASGIAGFSATRVTGEPVTGAPYSAVRIVEQVQIGSDGTRFTHMQQKETVYRDSQGRTRTDRLTAGPQVLDSPYIIEILDPVAKVNYTLDTQSKIAHRVPVDVHGVRVLTRNGDNAIAFPAAGTAVRSGTFTAFLPPPGAGAPSFARVEGRHEDLGQQSIEGVLATGSRTVETWPAGSQGSDRPFAVIRETWFSPDLKEPVLMKITDPRSGESTVKLTNISLSEPAASLFVPPADYQIVDETGQFQIHWTAPRQ